ncbi:MAG: bifunctional riboflavin kinase/FAD synthetase [Deltaproteobacteria bacterium]|nr:bifunctional riboflavin kinase/FAD synthetase [Deltaproteobacteria bacterium]
MRVINSLQEIVQPLNSPAVTIGNFDGVHLGHQALFDRVKAKAAQLGGESAAVTFNPHPLRVLREKNRPPLITLHEQKVELISAQGLDVLVSIPFTRKFAAIPARRFVEEVLVEKMGIRALVVGPDYCFGRGREGNVESLGKMAEELGFELLVVPWVEIADPDGERISSTRIRQLVGAGEVTAAKRLLGRDYQVRGVVGRGRDRGGKKLGFPTANLVLEDELVPQTGVYAVRVRMAESTDLLPGVANIGYSPTFGEGQFTVEVHILDFSEDIYGRKIKVDFVQRLRGEIKFDSIEALVAQIRRDCDEARRILSG